MGIFFLSFSPSGNAAEDNCAHVLTSKGYEYSVFAEGLPSVDNLTMTSDGKLYATLERGHGHGEVVRILSDGSYEVIIDGLRRPDGIRAGDGKLFIVEESKRGRVIEYDLGSKQVRVVARLPYVEGLNVISKDEVLLTEDRKKGKLISLTSEGKSHVLMRGLKRPEGIVVDSEGTVFIAETATGKVLKYSGGRLETVLDGLNKPDQLAIDGTGALLISEDSRTGRLFAYKDGKLRIIASCLRSPQGILPVRDGILLSEQSRGRVLKFRKK